MSNVLKSLRDCVNASAEFMGGDSERAAEFFVEIAGQRWAVYEAFVGYKEFTLYCEQGAATFVVDDYGNRLTCELLDWEMD